MKLLSFSLLSLAMTMAGEPTCNPENWSTTAPVETQPQPSNDEYNCYIRGCVYDVESEEKLTDAYIDVPQAGIKGCRTTAGRYDLTVYKPGTYSVIARHALYAIDSCSVTVNLQTRTGYCAFGLKKMNSL